MVEKQKKQSRTKKKGTNETSVLKTEGAHNESEGKKLTNAIKFLLFLFSFLFYLLLVPSRSALIFYQKRKKKNPQKEAEKKL